MHTNTEEESRRILSSGNGNDGVSGVVGTTIESGPEGRRLLLPTDPLTDAATSGQDGEGVIPETSLKPYKDELLRALGLTRPFTLRVDDGQFHKFKVCLPAPDFFGRSPCLDQCRGTLWDAFRNPATGTWLLVTGTPENITALLPADWNDKFGHVWLGLSVGNAGDLAKVRILKSVPADKRVLWVKPSGMTPAIFGCLDGIDLVVLDDEDGGIPAAASAGMAKAIEQACRVSEIPFARSPNTNSRAIPVPAVTVRDGKNAKHSAATPAKTADVARAVVTQAGNSETVEAEDQSEIPAQPEAQVEIPATAPPAGVTLRDMPLDGPLFPAIAHTGDEPETAEAGDGQAVEPHTEPAVEVEVLPQEQVEASAVSRPAPARRKTTVGGGKALTASSGKALKISKALGKSPETAELGAPLSDADRDDFRRLDAVVREAAAKASEAGLALREIHDRKLWRAGGCASWNAYCENVKGMTRRNANMLVAAAAALESMREVGNRFPTSTGLEPAYPTQMIELSRVKDPVIRHEAWNTAVTLAGGEQPAVAVVKKVVRGVLERQGERNEPASSPPAKTRLRFNRADALALIDQAIEAIREGRPRDHAEQLLLELRDLVNLANS